MLKHIKTDWCQSCIQNKLACWVSSTLSYLFAIHMFKKKNFSGALSPEPPPPTTTTKKLT